MNVSNIMWTKARSEIESIMDDIAADMGANNVKLLEITKISESGEPDISDWCIFMEDISFSKIYRYTWGRAYILTRTLEYDAAKDEYYARYNIRNDIEFNEKNTNILGFFLSQRRYENTDKIKVKFHPRKPEEDESNTIISNKAIMTYPNWSYGLSSIDLLVPDNGKLTLRSYKGYVATSFMMDQMTNDGWTTLIPESFNKTFITRSYAKSHDDNDAFASSYSTYMTLDTLEHCDNEIESLGNEIRDSIVNNEGYYIDPDDTVMEIVSNDNTLFVLSEVDIPVGYPILSICSLSEDDKD